MPILYVEDDALVGVATVDLLESAGYLIHPAADASRALTLLDEHPEVELMVTDVGLPGMNGHELVAQARRRRPQLKVLFLTGYDRTRMTNTTAEDATTKYLGKPYQSRELLAALRQLSGDAEGDGPRLA